MAMRMQPEPGCGRAGVNLFTHKLAFLEDLRSHLGQRELLRRFSENGREAALRARHRRQVLTDANAQNVLHSLRGWNLKPVCTRGWRTILPPAPPQQTSEVETAKGGGKTWRPQVPKSTPPRPSTAIDAWQGSSSPASGSAWAQTPPPWNASWN